MLRIAQRRGLGIDLMCALAYVCALENAETFGIGGHEAVLDSVVHHLDEVTGAIWAAVQITLLCRTADLIPPGCAWDVARARRERSKNWIEMLHDFLFATDHHAVTAFKAPGRQPPLVPTSA